ncbi:hypothetical protein GUITHDRAFT_155864 [Guillardia theta CCMP2712]|uniref:RWP-RK domain-containing protein n=5 Tax=Guillardia theta TaxID=55529 RepID=L1ICN1_GUITC|nr:hypothetical protein GUITHDRAFT_155864 [Guillardia theta CCMP2712]EKX33993.1 hypothetical protein GUITHDRAFT_155864 [Guillardia theta CCMP2712]|mmetsp:Transcript_26317/g.86481  ORF Transcript_26317/g.86481 Transcript_26317/m.86481 type:complete len:207 (+) Transcript_26317:228-848(+)|eukprot:XP_005820973.1 hypothetical protein GUITHDRAFT_155864 [Guillardia theta CCMP2712]
MDEKSKRKSVALVCPRKKKEGDAPQQDEPVVLTRELLESYFHCSLSSVSEQLGICPTAIKRACRKLGIAKWPFKTPNPGPKKKPNDAGKQNRSTSQTEKAEIDSEKEASSTNIGNKELTCSSFKDVTTTQKDPSRKPPPTDVNEGNISQHQMRHDSIIEPQSNFLGTSSGVLDYDPFAADTISFLRDVCKCKTTFYQPEADESDGC